MRLHGVALTALALALPLAVVPGCGDDGEGKGDDLGQVEVTGGNNDDAGAGDGAAAGGAPSAGGAGGAGSSSEAGAGGDRDAGGHAIDAAVDAAAVVCGDGVAAGAEECDGDDFGLLTCVDFGFDVGTLGCRDDCTAEPTGCSGSEQCADGRDNDGDSETDCTDSDCGAACADACLAPTVLLPGSSVRSTTGGHADTAAASCGSVATGPDLAFSYTPQVTGELELSLESRTTLTLSVRQDCAAQNTEIACGFERLVVSVTTGQPLTILVDGYSAADLGQFTLATAERKVVCGDGVRALTEGCDDGNPQPADGCDATCRVESSETEPNKRPNTANDFASPFFGEIDPAGDADAFRVDIPQDAGTVTIATLDFGDDACALGLLDNVLTLIGPDGTSTVVTDDDSGEGLCAKIEITGLSAGTYYVVVEASPWATLPTFPYIIETTIGP